MNIFSVKPPLENRSKSPEFVTPGDIRGMAIHLSEVDASVALTTPQMGRYPARAAIELVQNDANKLTSALGQATQQIPEATQVLNLDRIRQTVDLEVSNA